MATKTNKKDWSLVIWLFGWLLNFVTVLKKLATKLGVPFEAFERLGSEAGEETLARVLRLILDDYNDATPPALPPDHYRVWISYRGMPSLAQLEERWGKNNVSGIFNGRPFTPHTSCVRVSRVPGRKVFYLHDPGRDWESEERIAWGLARRNDIAPRGYRPATEEEAYEFAEARPELANYVGLGASILNDGRSCVARVRRGLGDGQRILDYSWFYFKWPCAIRVLFVSM